MRHSRRSFMSEPAPPCERLRVAARNTHALVLAGVLALIPHANAFAAWPHAPGTNLTVSAAANEQSLPAMVSDGVGGTIVTWQDFRGGVFSDIYAQHLLA